MTTTLVSARVRRGTDVVDVALLRPGRAQLDGARTTHDRACSRKDVRLGR